MEQNMSTFPTADDATISRVLAAFATARMSSLDLVLEPIDELVAALREAFPLVDSGWATPANEAALARAALEVVFADDLHRPALETLLRGPAPEKMPLLETAAIVTGALVVLQTRVRIERKTNGKWSLIFDKATAEDALLAKLVSRLLSVTGKLP
jgi:hypothetical protein